MCKWGIVRNFCSYWIRWILKLLPESVSSPTSVFSYLECYVSGFNLSRSTCDAGNHVIISTTLVQFAFRTVTIIEDSVECIVCLRITIWIIFCLDIILGISLEIKLYFPTSLRKMILRAAFYLVRFRYFYELKTRGQVDESFVVHLFCKLDFELIWRSLIERIAY